LDDWNVSHPLKYAVRKAGFRRREGVKRKGVAWVLKGGKGLVNRTEVGYV